MIEWVQTEPELLLFAAAVLLYLQDLSLLLFANEVVLVRSGNGPWAARAAHRHPEFARRYLAMPRPYRPDTLVVRTCWPAAHAGDEERSGRIAQSVGATERRLRFLRFQVLPLQLCMFIGLPLLYGLHGALMFLLGLAVVYGQVILMVACLLVSRKRLGLRWTPVVLIALESLVCVPHAINLYRKVAALMLPQDEEPVALAAALLDGEARSALRSDLLQALDAHIGLPGEDARKQERLVCYRQQVFEWNAA